MTQATRRVLITGGTGAIGQMLADRWADRYDLVLTDVEEDETGDGGQVEQADVQSLGQQVVSMEGVDTVVHLAGAAAPDSTWEDVLEANIIGVRNVLEAAREAGVRRVVFASTNHTMGMYDRNGEWPVYQDQLPRPDSLYGVSKVFGETLGRFYHDEYGLEFIAIRIGWSTKDASADAPELLTAMWLSPDDTAQVFERAIEADVPFGIYYAVSDNANRRWDMTNTTVELGFRPKDSFHRTFGIEEDVVLGGAEAPKGWPDQ